ncbi:hypothetical protein C8J56DRAFT_954755 [Mycena floridula]|nr:hypothetical protein C8J56DRAFT_954755 [Mycena floridula]
MASTVRTYGRSGSSAKRKHDQTAEENCTIKKQKARATVSPEPPKTRPSTERALARSNTELSFQSDTQRPKLVSKRMLGRSKTESSVEGSSQTSSSITRTPSLPVFLSPSQGSISKIVSSSSSPQKPSPSRPIRTYAGSSRSFLAAFPVDGLDNLQESQEDDFLARESYASLRSRWGVDQSEDDPYTYPSASNSAVSTPSGSPSKKDGSPFKQKPINLEPGMMNPLKSITELRNKGENRMFLDEVGYLLEGMEQNGGTGLKRATALEITTKLCDSEFLRKAKAADFVTQAWDSFIDAGAGQGKDAILDILLAFLAALISRDGLLPASFVPMLFKILVNVKPDEDPLILCNPTAVDGQLKRLGYSKHEQKLFRTIYTTMERSDLFPANLPLSTSLVLTQVLSTLPPRLLSSECLRDVLVALQMQFSMLPTQVPFAGIHNILILLDTYLLGQWSGPDGATDAELVLAQSWLVDGLVDLGMRAQDVDSRDSELASKCTESLLRILVSLTHTDNAWCRQFLRNHLAIRFIITVVRQTDSLRSGDLVVGVKEEEEDQRARVKVKKLKKRHKIDDHAQSLDLLCLALGLLINLVQVQPDEVKHVLGGLEVEGCNSLTILTEAYIHQSNPALIKLEQSVKNEDGEAENPLDPDRFFLVGHLALLLGMLMQRNRANQGIVIDTLPSLADSRAAKLSRLIKHIRALGSFYQGVEVDGDQDVTLEVVAFLERLKAV